MTTVNKKKFPPCYGNIDCVFPMAGDGLRHSPESCMPCSYKTDCLRKAMSAKGGITVKEEMVDRAYASGKVGFLERWSRRKTLSMQKRKQDKS